MRSLCFAVVSFFFCFSALAAQESSSSADFDVLMGKNTSHWQYIHSQSDIEFLGKCKKIYQQAMLPSDELAYRIPTTVHFIWLGPKAFPPSSVENVRSWIAKNPDWNFVFWTDSDRMPPCNGMEVRYVKNFTFSKLGERYAASENWGEKSDILRYEILLKEGGVYVDHDANCLQPFASLHKKYDLYCCLETPHTPFAGQNVTCGNGVIGARAGHPTLSKVIDLIDSRWDALGKSFRGKDHHSKEELVMQRTYIALTDVIKENIALNSSSRDIILPSAYFFAKNGIKSLFSKHFYANSWAENDLSDSEWEKMISSMIAKMKSSSNQFILHFFLICALSLISVVMLFAIAIKIKQRYFSKSE